MFKSNYDFFMTYRLFLDRVFHVKSKAYIKSWGKTLRFEQVKVF